MYIMLDKRLQLTVETARTQSLTHTVELLTRSLAHMPISTAETVTTISKKTIVGVIGLPLTAAQATIQFQMLVGVPQSWVEQEMT